MISWKNKKDIESNMIYGLQNWLWFFYANVNKNKKKFLKIQSFMKIDMEQMVLIKKTNLNRFKTPQKLINLSIYKFLVWIIVWKQGGIIVWKQGGTVRNNKFRTLEKLWNGICNS
jgi:hypothetical protein